MDDLLDMTDYIAAHLGKEKVILVGHSFGTYIAMQAANKVPENMKRILVLGKLAIRQKVRLTV